MVHRGVATVTREGGFWARTPLPTISRCPHKIPCVMWTIINGQRKTCGPRKRQAPPPPTPCPHWTNPSYATDCPRKRSVGDLTDSYIAKVNPITAVSTHVKAQYMYYEVGAKRWPGHGCERGITKGAVFYQVDFETKAGLLGKSMDIYL